MRHPVFIVGSPRSGTSALVDVMRSSGYKGFLEGNFLTLIQEVNHIVDRHYVWFPSDDKRVLLSNVNKDELKRKLFETFRTIVDNLNPEPPWFDKTGNPEMIVAIPVLRELLPSAVFVFAKRRGIENVISRTKKFPNHPFEYHCVNWARNMSAWRATRAKIPPDCFIEVEQRNMIKHPEAAARELCTFLGIGEGMLPIVSKVMDTHRPQETMRGSASQTFSMAATGWNQEQVETFLKHCESEMNAFGYTLDERYSISPDAL